MGFTPQQMNAMSLWQLFAALNGQGGNEGGLSETEKDELFAWINADKPAEQLSTMTYALDGLRLVPAGVVRFTIA